MGQVASSRLSVDGDNIYLSTPVVVQADTIEAHLSPVGFILTKTVVTIRFAEFKAFNVVSKLVARDQSITSSAGVFTALLEAIVDRGADVLERLGGELDDISRSIFRGHPAQRQQTVRSNTALRRILFMVGSTGDRLALARDVILGISRIAPFGRRSSDQKRGRNSKARNVATVKPLSESSVVRLSKPSAEERARDAAFLGYEHNLT